MDLTPYSGAEQISLTAPANLQSHSTVATNLKTQLRDNGFGATAMSETITIDVAAYNSGFEASGAGPTEVLAFSTATDGNGELIRSDGTGSWIYDGFADGQQLNIVGVRYNPAAPLQVTDGASSSEKTVYLGTSFDPDVELVVTTTAASEKTLQVGSVYDPTQMLTVDAVDPTKVTLATAVPAGVNLINATLHLDTVADGNFDTTRTITAYDGVLELTLDTALTTSTSFTEDNWKFTSAVYDPTQMLTVDAVDPTKVTLATAVPAGVNLINATLHLDTVADGNFDTTRTITAYDGVLELTLDTALTTSTSFTEDNWKFTSAVYDPTQMLTVDAVEPTKVTLATAAPAGVNLTDATLYLDTVADGNFDTTRTVTAYDGALELTLDIALTTSTSFTEDNWKFVLKSSHVFPNGVTGAQFVIAGQPLTTVADGAATDDSSQLIFDPVSSLADGVYTATDWALYGTGEHTFPGATSGDTLDITGGAGLGSYNVSTRDEGGKALTVEASGTGPASLNNGQVLTENWALNRGLAGYNINSVTKSTVTFTLPEDHDVPTVDPPAQDESVTSTGTTGGSYQHTPNHVDVDTTTGDLTLTRGAGNWHDDGFLENQYLTITIDGTVNSSYKVKNVRSSGSVLTLKDGTGLNNPPRIIVASANDLKIEQRPFTLQATFPTSAGSGAPETVFTRPLPAANFVEDASVVDYSAAVTSNAESNVGHLNDEDEPHRHYKSLSIDLIDTEGGRDVGQVWHLEVGKIGSIDRDAFAITVEQNDTEEDLANKFVEEINEVEGDRAPRIQATQGANGSFTLSLNSTAGPRNTLWNERVKLFEFKLKSAFTLNSNQTGLALFLVHVVDPDDSTQDLNLDGDTTSSDVQTFKLAEEGLYRVHVASPGPWWESDAEQQKNTVSAGVHYNLHLEVERHPRPHDSGLNGKRLRITSGTGAGHHTTIEEYHTHTRQLTTTGEWYDLDDTKVTNGITPDETSRLAFEKEFSIPGQHARSSTDYHVFLTGAPEGDVKLRIAPQNSRTYNSDRAFDADKGTRNDFQVEVCSYDAASNLTNCNTNAKTLTFTNTNWHTPQRLGVQGHYDNVIDGSDALVFPGLDERTHHIRGPLSVDGGMSLDESLPLDDPFLYPGEVNRPQIDGSATSDSTDVTTGSGTTFGTQGSRSGGPAGLLLRPQCSTPR